MTSFLLPGGLAPYDGRLGPPQANLWCALTRGRWLGAALLAVLTAGLVALSSPMAHAATSIPVTCTETSITIYGTVGDEFEFSGSGSCNSNWEFYNTVDYFRSGVPGWLEYRSDVNMALSSGAVTAPQDRWYAYFSAGSPSSVTVRLMATNFVGTPLLEGSTIAEVDNDGVPAPSVPSIIIPIIYGGTSRPAATSTAWTVIRQSLPLASDGTCSTVDDRDYAWGSGLTGGWVRSWEPWVSGGTGGWACNRTLVSKGRGWIVDNAA